MLSRAGTEKQDLHVPRLAAPSPVVAPTRIVTQRWTARAPAASPRSVRFRLEIGPVPHRNRSGPILRWIAHASHRPRDSLMSDSGGRIRPCVPSEIIRMRSSCATSRPCCDPAGPRLTATSPSSLPTPRQTNDTEFIIDVTAHVDRILPRAARLIPGQYPDLRTLHPRPFHRLSGLPRFPPPISPTPQGTPRVRRRARKPNYLAFRNHNTLNRERRRGTPGRLRFSRVTKPISMRNRTDLSEEGIPVGAAVGHDVAVRPRAQPCRSHSPRTPQRGATPPG